MTDRLDRIEARLRQVEEGLACALRRLDAGERPPLAGGIGATPALTAPRSREAVAGLEVEFIGRETPYPFDVGSNSSLQPTRACGPRGLYDGFHDFTGTVAYRC